MVAHLVERKVCIEDGGCTTPTFKDPTENGILNLSNKKWIKETLDRTTATDPDSNLQEREEDITELDDIEYMLADILT